MTGPPHAKSGPAPIESARLRDLGFNIIPVRRGTKMPRAGANDIMDWRTNGCRVQIRDDDNIAMLHGGVGGTWAMDCDDPTILEDLLDDYEANARKMCIVKTPKQGHHILFRRDDTDAPPGDPKYADGKGRCIDIKSLGYTLLPPSVHPEKHLGRYEYLYETNTPNIAMRWSDAALVLRSRGFFTAQEREQVMADVARGPREKPGYGSSSSGAGAGYDYQDLLKGGFGPGERRRRQNSLYIKKRMMGSNEQDAERAVREVNMSCKPPLDEREVRYNIRGSERFYRAHCRELDTWRGDAHGGGAGGDGGGGSGAGTAPGAPGGRGARGGEGGGRGGRNSLNAHMCADTIMHECEYIGHPSGEMYYYAGGIWIRGGEHRLRKSCMERWSDDSITISQMIEIENLVKVKRGIIPDGTDEDAFDRDATKIVLQNGTYDLEKNELVEHSHKHMATIRHPVAYDPDAACPIFDRAMDAWFDGTDKAKYQAIILEMFALCMLRRSMLQKGYVHYGKGGNGKSTCLSVLRSMLGRQNTASIEMQAFEENRFVGDMIYGKSANIASDGGTQPLVRTGLIKAILGGDSITCEPKFKRAFVFQPYCTMVFTFNELPPVLDSSDGFARKIQLVPWLNRFECADGEIEGLARNESERSGILNRILPIMRGFLLEGRRPAYEDTVEETQNLWMRRSDSFYLFRSECIVQDGRHQIEVNRLNTAYKEACSEHGMTPLSRNEFYGRVSELLGGAKPASTRVDGRNARVWRGLTVRSELRPEGQEALDAGSGASAAAPGGGA